MFSSLYGLETVSFRYFNVFGPRQDPSSQYSGVLSRFIPAMLKGEPPVIFGDGEQSRDFTYVSNVVKANLLACQSGKAVGNVYNVACGTRFNLKEVVGTLNRILGTNLKPVHDAPRPGDIRHSHADISRAANDLGYSPQTTLRTGLIKQSSGIGETFERLLRSVRQNLPITEVSNGCSHRYCLEYAPGQFLLEPGVVRMEDSLEHCAEVSRFSGLPRDSRWISCIP